jgi:glutaminyl-peptide cyclotransferase
MLIILIILLLLFIYFTNSNENFGNIDNIKSITKKISINRPIESENLFKVKKYVMNELKKLNLSVEEQIFTKKDHNFSNIIGVNEFSNTKEYILLCAHIDSIKENIESTIDSATSIAIILEITQKILLEDPKYPLILVFFDGEEAVDGHWSKDNTLFGSRYFVDNLKYNIKEAYILDLIGGDFKNKIAQFSNNINSYKHIKELYEINKEYDKIIFDNPDEYVSNKIIEDDHLPFQEKNINYIHLIPYNFPDSHHSINDNYNNVNWEYVYIFADVLYRKLINQHDISQL